VVCCVAVICLKAFLPKLTILLLSAPLILLFSVGVLFHRKLAEDAPEKSHLTEFYLWMSFGDMLGGLFNSIFAPLFFTEVTEFPLIVVLSLLGCSYIRR
tara:strand:- start:608 stop:904 length:297 start_codon:yes stop_codon:yes gene_type:complete